LVDVFSEIFELEIAARAKSVQAQLIKTTEIYFDETWDSSEALTASLDLAFSALDYETSEFVKRVSHLDQAIGQLEDLYQQFVLGQVVVMLVGSLEIFLSAVFKSCLEQKLDLNQRAISSIMSRYNFQNWGSSTDAFRTFFEIELCPEGVDSSTISTLQQKRHVLVHRLGELDKRAVSQLGLQPSSAGRRLTIELAEVVQGIELVRAIGEHLCQLGDGIGR
jgi:hypothetical protein